jgi:hypothetical protein
MDEIKQFTCTPKTVVINYLVGAFKQNGLWLRCAADRRNLPNGLAPALRVPHAAHSTLKELELGGDMQSRPVRPLMHGVAAS